ncbi:uncharacterized protein YehP domain protein [Leptospira borgpetersenii serovar Hardjo-bovis str. Sponselee]|uniref:Uncharacterized protein YehP domain protein n=1 Tax=Leptospira borgpetersenii serovar Hardjo-bovis str. Sponselee TaxID=1303729 RepID=M6C0Q0_LEPBO|nr:uncharacterized protein YehP domain protein [Leptospira borgpetersenii serovar Hardjo-bovis str. Sponselee]
MGNGSEQSLGDRTFSEEQQRMDRAIEYLYGRAYRTDRGGEERNVRAGMDDSDLTVPLWINEIHELFPKKRSKGSKKTHWNIIR